MEKVALFPIPGSVSFPGTSISLHVFEPRYRKMVDYCVSNEVLLGVTHTKDVIREARRPIDSNQALNSNASTYKACEIFSAGKCSIKKTLDDGRLLIKVDMEHRFRSVETIQRLPFEILSCEIISDRQLPSEDLKKALMVREKIIVRLKALCAQSKEMMKILDSGPFLSMPLTDFSFRIFQLIRFDPEQQQSILELRNPLDRLNFMLTQLNRA